MTSRGWEQDLIESIAEDIALTSHIEEKLVVSEDEQEIENLKLMLKEVLSLRREKMSYLLSQGEKPNPMYWCQFKHSLGSWIRAVEVYEAVESDESQALMIKAKNNLAMATSLFLGMEFEVCGRCLADRLLVKQKK